MSGAYLVDQERVGYSNSLSPSDTAHCQCARCGLSIINTGNPLAIMAAKTIGKRIAKHVAKKLIDKGARTAHDLSKKSLEDAKGMGVPSTDKALREADRVIDRAKKEARKALRKI
jgi:hypothetical protein